MACIPWSPERALATVVLGVAFASVALGSTPAVTVVSQAADGTAGSGTAQWVEGLPRGARAISDDGRFAVFQSSAGNLVSGVPGGFMQVYLRDLRAGTTSLVSHASSGPTTAGDGSSTQAVISADGRYVAFASQATNLTNTTDNPATLREVYRYTVATGSIVDVSYSSTATTPVGGATSPRISTDGSVIAFTSDSPDLIPGQVEANSDIDLFAWHGMLALVSRATGGWTTTGDGALPTDAAFDLSTDGRYLTFASDATNLVSSPDGNGLTDLYQFDRLTGSMAWVSEAGAGGASDGTVDFYFWSSPGGDWVAYSSSATNLALGVTDANGQPDVYLWERSRHLSSLVSHTAGDANATAGADLSGRPMVSDDGRYVLLQTARTDLIAGGLDSNNAPDLFLFDRVAATVALISHQAGSSTTAASAPSGQGSSEAVLSRDGSWAAFTSDGRNLVAAMTDNNGSGGTDVYLWQGSTTSVSLMSHTLGSATGTGNLSSSQAQLTPNGNALLFRSSASDLTAASDTNGTADVFAALDLQPDLFADSFENGDTTAWSVPPFPPDTVLTGEPAVVTNLTSDSFSFTSNPPGGLFECSVDGAAFASCTTPFTTDPLAEGDHSFAVRAKSVDGVDASPAAYFWRIDTTAPNTAIHTGPDNPTPSTTATFSFSSNEGDTTFECRLDGASFVPCISPQLLPSVPAGPHTYYVRAVDGAGNSDSISPASWSWTVN